MDTQGAPTAWGCAACTLVNSTLVTACAACATPRQPHKNPKRPREVGGYDGGCAIVLCSSSEDEGGDGDSLRYVAPATALQPANAARVAQTELADRRQRQRQASNTGEPLRDPQQLTAAAAAAGDGGGPSTGNDEDFALSLAASFQHHEEVAPSGSVAAQADEVMALALQAKYQRQGEYASVALAQQLQGTGKGKGKGEGGSHRGGGGRRRAYPVAPAVGPRRVFSGASFYLNRFATRRAAAGMACPPEVTFEEILWDTTQLQAGFFTTCERAQKLSCRIRRDRLTVVRLCSDGCDYNFLRERLKAMPNKYNVIVVDNYEHLSQRAKVIRPGAEAEGREFTVVHTPRRCRVDSKAKRAACGATEARCTRS